MVSHGLIYICIFYCTTFLNSPFSPACRASLHEDPKRSRPVVRRHIIHATSAKTALHRERLRKIILLNWQQQYIIISISFNSYFSEISPLADQGWYDSFIFSQKGDCWYRDSFTATYITIGTTKLLWSSSRVERFAVFNYISLPFSRGNSSYISHPNMPIALCILECRMKAQISSFVIWILDSLSVWGLARHLPTERLLLAGGGRKSS